MRAVEHVGVVFVHGFISKPKTWRHFERLIAEDAGLTFARPLTFGYSSPLMSLNPLRHAPSYEDVADALKVFLETRAGDFDRLVLATHSQGGLIVQRYLHRMLSDGRGADLQRIRQIVLFACPNSGAQLANSLPWLKRHAQGSQLRSLTRDVIETQRTVVNRVVNALEVRPDTCPIPITAYAGMSDNIVPLGTAQGVFKDTGALPGDHFTIIRPDSATHLSYLALRQKLIIAHTQAGREIKSTTRSDQPGTHDRRSAPTILRNSPEDRMDADGDSSLLTWRRNVLLAQEQLIHVDHVIDQITEAIESPVSNSAVAVHGDGGVGKTAVTYAAVERAEAHGQFTHVVWASARNTRFSALDASSAAVNSIYWHDLIAMVARQLDCPLPSSQALWEGELATYLTRNLTNARILVVVDNLEFVAAADDVINRLRALGLQAPHKIVATTRWRSEMHDLEVRNIPVEPFTEGQTYDLIRLVAKSSDSDLAHARNSDLLPIFRITDGNPFLIKLIVSRYVMSGRSLPRIITELTAVSEGTDLAQRVRSWLFERSLDELALRASKRDALSLLFSFCVNGRGGAMSYSELWAENSRLDPASFDDLLESACRLNLIRPSDMNQRYSIHSLLYEHTCPLAHVRRD